MGRMERSRFAGRQSGRWRAGQLELSGETLPVGVVAPVPLVSITVAVHVTDPPMFIEAGLQLTEVLVGAGLTMTVVVLVLAA